MGKSGRGASDKKRADEGELSDDEEEEEEEEEVAPRIPGSNENTSDVYSALSPGRRGPEGGFRRRAMGARSNCRCEQ